ncbi:MAG: hypothetical protein ACJ79A_02555 [Gemmatimonadaceae bacterium]
MTPRLVVLGLAFLPVLAQAQAAPTPAVPAGAQQIAAAVLALPPEFRSDARVLGYEPGKRGLVLLREGKGPFTCLASDPAAKGFHVACYHQSLEPFMARGRALRASGVKGDQVDTVRFAEVRAKKLAVPTHPASLYQLFGPPDAFDASTGTAPTAKALYIVYMPNATVASTGLSAKPAEGTMWLMFPGTPKAHIMFEPKM